jgi:hypothetical protein
MDKKEENVIIITFYKRVCIMGSMTNVVPGPEQRTILTKKDKQGPVCLFLNKNLLLKRKRTGFSNRHETFHLSLEKNINAVIICDSKGKN